MDASVAIPDPITKVAVMALQRTVGWGIARVTDSLRRDAVTEMVLDAVPIEDLELTWIVDTGVQTSVHDYLRSPEFDQVAVVACRGLLVDGEVKRGAGLVATARELLGRRIAILDPATGDETADAIWLRLISSISSQIPNARGSRRLNPTAEAELVKMSASVAAASARNLKLSLSVERIRKFEEFEKSLALQVSKVHAKMKLPHVNTSRQVAYAELFVEPGLVAQDQKGSRRWPRAKKPGLSDILQEATRVVIVGDPGGGKSTLSVKLAHDVASGTGPIPARCSLVVVLKDFAEAARGADRRTLVDYMESLCKSPYESDPPEGALEYLLLNNRMMVIFDGLDELLDTSLRSDVVQAVEGFAHRYPTTSILVTSRRVGYQDAALDDELFALYGLQEFDHAQVEQYSENWFALDETLTTAEKFALQTSFIEDSKFVSDLRVNPLMLSLMCGIYASEKYIPRNRPEVYEKCAVMLFERWDRQRGIEGSLPFDAHVQSAMRALALHVYKQTDVSSTMSRVELIRFVTGYLLGRRFAEEEDAENAAVQFVDFCKGRAWVLSEVGADLFAFTHRTFLEFFAASQLVKQNNAPESLLTELVESIKQGSATAVNQLALQILGKNVEDGADDFLALVMDKVESAGHSDLRESENLTRFSVRALAFIVPRPVVLQRIVSAWVETLIRQDARARGSLRPKAALEVLQECAAENIPALQAALRGAVSERLPTSKRKASRLLSLVVLQPTYDYYGSDSRGSVSWLKWGNENVDFFLEDLLRLYPKNTWIALLLADFGKISAAAAIDARGTGSLYEHSQFEVHGGAPFAWRYLVGNGTEVGLIVPGNVSISEVMDDLVGAITSSRRGWIRAGSSIEIFMTALSRDLPAKSDALSILLVLPMIEAVGDSKQLKDYVSASSIDQESSTGSIEQESETDFAKQIQSLFEARRSPSVAAMVAGTSTESGPPLGGSLVEEWTSGRFSTLY